MMACYWIDENHEIRTTADWFYADSYGEITYDEGAVVSDQQDEAGFRKDDE